MDLIGNIELPKGWVWTTLGDVYSLEYGKGLPKEVRSEGNIPVYGSNGIVGYHDQALIDDPCIIIGRKGSVGEVHISKTECWPIDTTYYVIPPSNLDLLFSYYFFKNLHLEKLERSTAIPGINRTDVYKQRITIPPFVEQHRIVAKIEELFTQLDASEAALKRAKANLERYRRSVLQAAVTGDLTRMWREENHGNLVPAHEVVEQLEIERQRKWEYDLRQKGRDPRKATYQKPTVPDKSKLPSLPTKWDWVSVSQVGDINEQPVLTGPFGSTLGQDDFMDSGVPVLTIGCLTDSGLSLDKAMYIHADKALELDRYRVRSGDMLFSRMASVGRAGLVTPQFEGAIINYHLMRLRLASAVISPSYFVYFVKGSTTVQDYVREVNHGATRDGINTEQLSGLPIALPPLKEQEEIVRKIEEYLSFKEYEQSVIDQSLKRISRLKQSILEEAFKGRLVDQNPEDEPASVLLQRIQAEREEREKQQASKPKKEKKKMTEEQKRKPLVETLHAAGARLTPEELFRRAGFNEESVDEFYEELRQELQIEVDGKVVKTGRIKEERPNQAVIYLSEVKA